MKAYRKLAAQWHPDQYNGNDKQKAEKMFIDIAAAKEVLTDPGMSSVMRPVTGIYIILMVRKVLPEPQGPLSGAYLISLALRKW